MAESLILRSCVIVIQIRLQGAEVTLIASGTMGLECFVCLQLTQHAIG